MKETGMTTKVRSAKMTDEQKAMRENLLFAISDVIDILEAGSTDKQETQTITERQRGLFALKWLRGEMRKDGARYNVSVSQFFQVKEAKSHLKLDGLEFASQFFERPLSTLQLQCKRAGEPLPFPLLLLHKEYNERRGKSRMPVVNADPLSWMFTGAPVSKEQGTTQSQD
jgi:hypothetical protein